MSKASESRSDEVTLARPHDPPEVCSGIGSHKAEPGESQMANSLVSPIKASKTNAAWYLLFLEHLDEFATLAWYLVADHRLVEETILRTMAQLDAIPFDASTPQ